MPFIQAQLYLHAVRPVSQDMDAQCPVTPVSGAGINISVCMKKMRHRYNAGLPLLARYLLAMG